MLRKALLTFALALLALGLGSWLGGARGAWPMVLWGALLTAAVLFERWRYSGASATSKDAWQPTSERFVDPESGQPMQVWYNPSTGQRRYQALPQEDRPAA
ncbi:conserved exported hypothetical protein [Burkholderiales bacterium]|nr:conserved exported hypothetical protein [Burkholderiales bacterium]